MCVCVFFFNDTATTEIYTLSLHDALPISEPGSSAQLSLRMRWGLQRGGARKQRPAFAAHEVGRSEEHTSELQSPVPISYAVFCLKKKNKKCYM